MKRLILVLALCLSQAAFAWSGKVVNVHDGDTVTVLTPNNAQVKIRLAALDAPELKQAFGARSKQSLADMVYGKNVEVSGSRKDRYGRTLAKLWLDGVDINLAQIERGLAWHYLRYDKNRAYTKAENDARAAQVGLWADANPVAPWVYRRPKVKT